MSPGESWENHRIRTAKSLRNKWKKICLPLLVEIMVDKFWMTTSWALLDGDVPIMKALRSILEWKTTTWWRSRSAWKMATDPTDVTRWKRKFGFHKRGVQWDTPMSKWAREGNRWIQLMARGPPRKEDVTFNLHASMRQATGQKQRREGVRRRRKQETSPRL